RQRRTLRRWARAGQQVHIRRAVFLETHTPQLMARLRRRKHVRRHLGDTLSPTRSVLDPAGIPALLKTLAGLDLYVAPPPASKETDQSPTPLALSGADLGLLWMAAHLYQ